MDFKVDSGNGTAAETELPATAAVGTERALEAEAAALKEAESVADHPTVTIFAPAAETTFPEKVHSPMASNVHLGNGIAAGNPESETESEIPATVVEVAPEKELKPVADCPTVTELTTAAETTVPKKKRHVWAGDCLFRVIVPVLKVESIIRRNGDLIKKMCQETKANISVLEESAWHRDRIVLISGKEEIEPPLSPAMDAVIRVFKLINGFPENESDGVPSGHCSIRLLLTSMQATSLTGFQGSSISAIHRDAGVGVCLRSTWKKEKIFANSDDRVFELRGKGLKVLKALEAVLEHLRMLLVDHSIPPLFKMTVTQRRPILRSKAVDIIGEGGAVIANIGRTSGAILTVQEGKNKIAVEIKGTPSQVKAATQLLEIQIKTVNKPTSQPQEGTTLGFCTTDVDQTLAGPPELPQVQPATAPEPIETKPVMRASSDNSNVVEEAMQQMEAEEPEIPTRPEQAGPAVLDGMECNSESKRSRVSWEDENVVKTFLGACIHEIAIDGREGGSLKAKSWKKVGEVLNNRHNFCVDHKQMKNYFDGLESRYRSWLMLKNKIENMYDPSLDDAMKKNKCIEELWNASPPFPDLCGQLFDGAISTGIKSFNEDIPETNIQKDTMSLASPSSPVINKQKKGEVTLEPQAAGPLVPPSAANEAPVEPQKKPKRIKVYWNVKIVKTFLDACIHEIAINGREGGSLKAKSWKKVGEILKDRHNFSVDHKQIKSYFHGLKSKYKAWLSLKNKTGHKYDPFTNKFNLTDEEWETEMKTNKCVESLRKAPLRFPDLCVQLFDGVISTGLSQTVATSPSAETLLPSATTDTPHSEVAEPQKVCNNSSSVQVPADLPQVQPATTLKTIETEAEVPPELSQVQPAIETIAEVPPELPQVQPASALEAIETKAEVAVSSDDLKVVDEPEPMEMEVEESVVQTRPVRAFSAQHLAYSGPGENQYRPPVLNMLTFDPLDDTAPGMECISEPKRSRVSWEDENVVKTFLNACIHEIAINGQEDGSLMAMSWRKVGEILEDRRNFSVDYKQMKNYFDGLKKYIAWLSLKNKTNNEYDPSTNTFNLTDKEWETELKKNKCIETLRIAPLSFPDLCAQLFDGAISTGFSQTGVHQALMGLEPGEITDETPAAVPLVPPSAETSQPEAPVEPQKEPIMCSSRVEVSPELPQVPPPSEVVPIETKRSMSVFEEEILGLLKMIADNINKPQPPSKPTLEDCEKKLNELEWAKDDPLHLVALTIFYDENDKYRELWMKLNPNLCADWVRMIGRSKRFT